MASFQGWPVCPDFYANLCRAWDKFCCHSCNIMRHHNTSTYKDFLKRFHNLRRNFFAEFNVSRNFLFLPFSLLFTNCVQLSRHKRPTPCRLVKFCAFWGSWKFMTLFTGPRNWSLSLSQTELAASKKIFLQLKYYFEKRYFVVFVPQFIQNKF
jgi:hypothetical protein